MIDTSCQWTNGLQCGFPIIHSQTQTQSNQTDLLSSSADSRAHALHTPAFDTIQLSVIIYNMSIILCTAKPVERRTCVRCTCARNVIGFHPLAAVLARARSCINIMVICAGRSASSVANNAKTKGVSTRKRTHAPHATDTHTLTQNIYAYARMHIQ